MSSIHLYFFRKLANNSFLSALSTDRIKMFGIKIQKPVKHYCPAIFAQEVDPGHNALSSYHENSDNLSATSESSDYLLQTMTF